MTICPRVPDRHGHVPRRGAIAEYLRDTGRSRPTVLADLRAGRLCVNSAGQIAVTTGAEVATARREPGRRCVLPLTAGANHGALLRARAKFGLGVRPTYLRIERGEIILDRASGEFITAPVPPVVEPSAAPAVRDRRSAIIGDVELYLDDLAAVDPAASEEFANKLVNVVRLNLASRRAAS